MIKIMFIQNAKLKGALGSLIGKDLNRILSFRKVIYQAWF